MGYAQITSQLSMAMDETRNKVYLAALKKVITPDSVVLDLGAGLGPFGLLAAKLGAKKVYLVEPQPLIRTVNNVIKDNGLQDCVECIQGNIEDIELPEKVDVITSCFTGNFLLSEDLLPSLFYARDRYLKPGGCLIPDSGRMMAAPICAPKAYKQQISRLSKPHLGIDYSYYRKFVVNRVIPQRSFKSKHFLAKPKSIMTLDFTTATKAECSKTLGYDIDTSSDCHGFLGWFDITLGGQVLSSAPDAPAIHWSPLWFLADPPIPVETSEQLFISIKKQSQKAWDWTFSSKEIKQVHSAGFAGMVLNASKKEINDENKSLSEGALQLLFVLKAFNQGWEISRIKKQLCQNWPEHFTSDQAKKYVVKQRKLYCK